MDFLETKEQLNAQDLELLNDFQMEELEERMEMEPWLKSDPPPPQTPGSVQVVVATVSF